MRFKAGIDERAAFRSRGRSSRTLRGSDIESKIHAWTSFGRIRRPAHPYRAVAGVIPGPQPRKPEMVFPVLAGLNEKDSREALRAFASVSRPSIAFSVNVAGRTRAILASFITLTTLPFSLPPQINDISLEDYIGVKSKHAVYVPHTAGRYAQKRFRKAQCPITERLVNALMMHGRNNGKKLMAVRIVKHAMDIIHLLSDQNPIQVIVDAIINAGPREDATRVGSAGVIRRQAVDISPLRRVNQAIYLITTGAREAAFRNVKTIAECLADELINAAKGSSNSYAIKKKDELERVAKANR